MLLLKTKTLTTSLVSLFLVVNLLFIFLQIHKQSQFVKISYARQRLEKEKEHLTKQKNDLAQQLLLQQSRKNVQNYASKQLNMRPTTVQQIHKIKREI